MKIIVPETISEAGLKVLRERFDVDTKAMDRAEIEEAIRGADALLVRSATKVDGKLIELGGRLKVIGRAGVGVDNIDVPAAAKRGIVVVNAPTAATESVAELTIGMMLALARGLPRADGSMKRGEWLKKDLMGTQLHDKTLGLIGIGRIGARVAEIAKALGMTIVAYDPFVDAGTMVRYNATKMTSPQEVVERADFVSMHLLLNDETRNLMDASLLSKMKPGAFLVNVSRGGVIDEKALYDALKAKRLAGAALDVYESEPPKASPLLTLENVILTPHIGASTREAQDAAGLIVAEDVKRVLLGERPLYPVKI
ncbi:MAG: hydroxyacid dehydrogenase [Euryarchaeota archaeon]|nr:hydroxyacid dehydrogenase [Euryarchaeota archaeon]